ncbi:GDSL-type esterase/lipase family protein [Pseudorhodoferax sp.]|uniref:GDSL-type esterase/lipase family protein n=1 Tax=Pseudorhodoferax sp. TaxID=1993553 RepID=UPI002DD645C0|nr:GDSL-type esterase/lipase family protein [Pseudorhodoferax sp.]
MPPTRRRSASRRRLVLGGLWSLAVPGLAACGRTPVKGQPVPPGATVLALGDSLTFGTGTTPESAYPAVLAALSGWQVVNAGVPGDTSAQVLERLPALLQEHRPALVLLGAGGNDLLRRLPEADTRRHLQQAVEQIRASGAQVLLVAVPRPSVAAAFTGSLSDHPLYGELAEAMKLPLHRQGWSEVLADARLRSDQIHANAEGYAVFARGLVATARAVGFLPR